MSTSSFIRTYVYVSRLNITLIMYAYRYYIKKNNTNLFLGFTFCSFDGDTYELSFFYEFATTRYLNSAEKKAGNFRLKTRRFRCKVSPIDA